MSKFSDFLLDISLVSLFPLFPIFFLIGLFFPDKAKNIIILGTKEAGKTTLWLGLGGIKEYLPNTHLEPIQSFTITRADGTTVVISETYDVGGEDEFVCNYDKLIKEETFIYYLVNANKITFHDYMTRVRSDLLKINKTAKDKNIPDDKIGVKFLLTHYYDYRHNNPGNSEHELYRQFWNELRKIEGRGAIGKRLTSHDFEKVMMVAELDSPKAAILGKNYIDIIKNEIGR